jgi:predicted CopG family antitoxin
MTKMIRVGKKFIKPGDKVYDMLTKLKRPDESYGETIFRLIRNYEDVDMTAARISEIFDEAKAEIIGTLCDGRYTYVMERFRILILKLVMVPEMHKKSAMRTLEGGLDKMLKRISKLTVDNQSKLGETRR